MWVPVSGCSQARGGQENPPQHLSCRPQTYTQSCVDAFTQSTQGRKHWYYGKMPVVTCEGRAGQGGMKSAMGCFSLSSGPPSPISTTQGQLPCWASLSWVFLFPVTWRSRGAPRACVFPTSLWAAEHSKDFLPAAGNILVNSLWSPQELCPCRSDHGVSVLELMMLLGHSGGTLGLVCPVV